MQANNSVFITIKFIAGLKLSAFQLRYTFYPEVGLSY